MEQLHWPIKKKHVKPFLGMAEYYCSFIHHFSDRALLLTNATKKDTPDRLKWSEELGKSFNNRRGALTGDAVLMSPDFSRSVILQTDALGVGLEAVLSQRDDRGGDRLVGGLVQQEVTPPGNSSFDGRVEMSGSD